MLVTKKYVQLVTYIGLAKSNVTDREKKSRYNVFEVKLLYCTATLSR